MKGSFFAFVGFMAATACSRPPDSSLESPVVPEAWIVSKAVDAITDKPSVVTYRNSLEGVSALRVECAAGTYAVNISGEQFYPSTVGDDDRFYVSYRFDSKPGVVAEDWNGLKHWATPLNEAAFLKEMLASKKLVVQVGSGVMDTVEASFDLEGLDSSLSESRKLCPSIPRL